MCGRRGTLLPLLLCFTSPLGVGVGGGGERLVRLTAGKRLRPQRLNSGCCFDTSKPEPLKEIPIGNVDPKGEISRTCPRGFS